MCIYVCCYTSAILQQYMCLHTVLLSCVGDVKPIKGFLEQFYGSFMEDACAEVVASELRRRQVISKRVETKIERALDLNEANGLLYDHLCDQGDFKTLEIVCDVFIGKQGYQQMNHLGARMKEEMIRRHTLGMLPHAWCTLYCMLPYYAALRPTL